MSQKQRTKLPEIGQWPDKLIIPFFILAVVGIIGGFLLAFLYASPVNGASVNGAELIGGQMVTSKLLISQKIFYFHMPVAIVSMIMMTFLCYYSIRFLISREQRYDTCAQSCAEIALLFVVATMLTGEMWTRFEWGVWWTWEPRLTTYLVLTLLIIAYFVLRNSVDDLSKKATFSAVLGIISFVDVPITFAVTRIIPTSLHPVVLREGGMTPDMALTVCVCLIGMCALAFVLYRIRFRNHRLEERIGYINQQLEDK